MELFLLFSLALTFIAFLSIVLAEPPAPLTLGIESDFELDRVVTTQTEPMERSSELPGRALPDNEHEPAVALSRAENLQAMF